MTRDRTDFLLIYTWLVFALAALVATRATAADPADGVLVHPAFWNVSFATPAPAVASDVSDKEPPNYFDSFTQPWRDGVPQDCDPAQTASDYCSLATLDGDNYEAPLTCGVCGDYGCGGCDDGGCFPRLRRIRCLSEGCLDRLVFTLGGDAFANKADDNGANNFGFNYSLNTSIPLGWLDGQVGIRHGFYDLYGRDSGAGLGSNPGSTEQQVFVTAGLYRRANVACGERWSGGLVWDYLHDTNFGEEDSAIHLNQLRGQVGYALNCRNEIGFWGTARLTEDQIDAGGAQVNVHSLEQYNLYWQHSWDYGAITRLSLGVADEPGEWVLGLAGQAPLNDRVGLYGGLHYIAPSTTPGDTIPNGVANSFSEETWNVNFGLVYYFGGRAWSPNVTQYYDVPLFNVADNSTFPVQAPTGGL